MKEENVQASSARRRAGSATYPAVLILFVAIGAVVVVLKPQGDANFISPYDRARNAAIQAESMEGARPAPPGVEAPKEETREITTAPSAVTPSPLINTPPFGSNVDPLGTAPSCLTATPAVIGTPFPCTTRVTAYNGHAFWKWTAAEERRKETLLAPMKALCEGVDPIGDAPQERPTTSLSVVGCSGYSGSWSRCWIVPLTNASLDEKGRSKPTCKAGDHFDVMIQSQAAKVAIDRVIDLDNGVYEMQFYIRKRGTYNVTIDKVVLHQAMPKGKNSVRLTNQNESIIGFVKTQKWMESLTPVVTVPPTPAWPNFTETTTADFNHGVDVVPVAQRCDEVYDADRFRFGGWAYLGNCDNVHCIGSLGARPSLEGWLWVSDVCILKIHTTQELETLLVEAWLVGWGGSTMKQPLSNFVEYYLRKPIFRVFMTQLDLYKKSRKRPNFFSYRQWDVRPYPSTRITMQWGGCPNLMAGPIGCSDLVGLGHWAKMQRLVADAPASDTNNRTIPIFPTALLLDMTVWRWPHNDDIRYLRTVDNLFKQIDQLVAANNQTRPLVVWHTTPMGGNSERGHRAASAPLGTLSLDRNFNWVHEDHMMRHHKDKAVLISRHQITLPLHFGNDWVHFGLHYGASEGMCNTGHNRYGYEFSLCVCKTWGDDAVIVSWLNAFAEHRKRVLKL
jgi:hypothetical protein